MVTYSLLCCNMILKEGRQAASRHLKALVAAGVLREQAFGKEKLFVNPKLMNLLTRDDNAFEPYRKEGAMNARV